MNVFSFSGLFIATTALILTFILLIYAKNRLHRIWTLFNLAVFVWGIGCFLAGKAASPSSALFGWRIAIIGGLFIAVFFYHMVYAFSGIQKKKILLAIYIQAAVFFLLTLMTQATLNNWRLLFNSIYYPKANFLYTIMVMSWVAVVCLGYKELIIVLKGSKGNKSIQAKYIFIAFLIGFIGGGPTLIPAFGIKIYPFGNFGVALYAIIGTYAILKYRLMDIKVAITRTGIFILVYTLVLGLPFVAAVRMKNWLIGVLGPGWWVAPLVLMAVLATVGPFVYIYLNRKAEERLLREQKRYQDILKQASVGMTRIRNLKKLLDLIAHIVTKTVHISYAGIYLYNRETDEYVLQVSRDKGRMPIPKINSNNVLVDWIKIKRDPIIYEEIKLQVQDFKGVAYKELEENMRILTASVVIPSFLEDKLLGFIVLGDKLSGQIYTPEDLNVFQVLASQAALAIENAQFYEEAKELHEQIAQAEKMATIGTMADGLSHQINNRFYALSLIAGDSIDTIKMTDTSQCTPEIKEMISQINRALGRIQANVTQGAEVVRGLLKYSRRGDTSFEALTIDQIIDGTLEMVQYKVKLSEIDIVRNYQKDTPKVYANLTQLEEAFFNFIDNAYDAIVERRTLLKEDGYRGKITVTAQAKDSALEIILEDNGMGVKDADFKKIFTPFFTTKISSRKGTGLGLYVVKKIITDTHKGKIAFESDYKVGTRFIIELPMAK